MAVGDAHKFPGFLIPVLAQLFFPKPPTTFLTYFRGERQKYAGKKVCLSRVSDSQPPGHESNMLTTELWFRPDDKKKPAISTAKIQTTEPPKNFHLINLNKEADRKDPRSDCTFCAV